ncbi:enoyl-CoA hydratase-related protein, partial [Pseudomonas aeruginosa]
SARFAQPEVRVGVMPGAGGTQRLVRAVGKFQALRMLFTGCTVRAPEALAIGLVSEVAADGQALDRALELARQIAGLPPLALAQIKEVVLAGADLPLDQALALERKAFQLLFDSHDQKEGMRAFLEKRTAEYLGK